MTSLPAFIKVGEIPATQNLVLEQYAVKIGISTLLGVNPIKKRKTEDKTLYYSEYESSKRVRSYSTEWEKDRPWLKLTDDGMVCLTCQAHGMTYI
jgi:hypothetical protein